MIKIPGYDVSSKLYESNQTIVYRGKRTGDGVAIVLKGQQYSNSVGDSHFTREYHIAQRIQSDGSINIYDIVQTEQGSILIIEDIGGESLRKLFDTAMTLSLFLPLAIQTSRNLGDIHRAGIIHKDINPSNIIYNPQTKQLRIIDFGIASELTSEAASAKSVSLIEGTLDYIAPEQTGRTNRSVDYRSDFYALGATFYELLSGQTIFDSHDPVELVYNHLARQPNPLTNIPSQLSALILKLLAKNAEDRYQSASGLVADLEHCWEMWQANGDIAPFALGAFDVSEQFRIPQKLYGRSAEISTLLNAFERATKGDTALMLVKGYSGIGKTALIREIHTPIVKQRGYFITGKFDQFRRNIPYESLIQAFKELVRRLLTESEATIAMWRDKLLAALNPNGAIITDVIPEMALIIGDQPAAPELSSTEALNRFNSVFQNFIEVFAKWEHPLVIFLDDLQWADTPSLQLLQHLLTSGQHGSLLIIGAYRDNEVLAGHPLQLMITEVAKSGLPVEEIALTNLTLETVTKLIADTLHTDPEKVASLAAQVHRKTAGNPFFVSQFLHSLYEKGALHFADGGWQWDTAQAEAAIMTDNVVELVAQKLQTLDVTTQDVLKIASCLGNKFDLVLLAAAYGQSPVTTAGTLWAALVHELIVQESTSAENTHYRFLHDRVQQAAYSLLAEADRPKIHLKIGRLMPTILDESDIDENIFDITSHLNQATDLLTETSERLDVARLNLRAGQKAMSATAYQPANVLFAAGIQLLPTESETEQYELTFALKRGYAESQHLSGDLEGADKEMQALLAFAQTTADKTTVYGLLSNLYMTQNRFLEAYTLCMPLIEALGETIPHPSGEIDLIPDIVRLQQNLGDRPIADLINLPIMEDPERVLLLDLLIRESSPAYFLNQALFALLNLRMVNLTIEHGLAPPSPFAIMLCGSIQTSALGQHATGYQFGQLAYAVQEKLGTRFLSNRLDLVYGDFIAHFHDHARVSIEYLERGYRDSIDKGDFFYAGYCGNVSTWYQSMIGRPLRGIYEQAKSVLARVLRAKDFETGDNIIVTMGMLRSLMGETEHPTSFQSDEYDEAERMTHMQQIAMKLPLSWYHIMKLRSHYLFGEYEAALEQANLSEPLLPFAAGLLQTEEHIFYHALTLAALYPDADDETQAVYMGKLNALNEQMQMRVGLCADNFEHKGLLISAEIARITNHPLKAMHLYDQAIASATDADYINTIALANEVAARFYTRQGRNKSAIPYWQDAYLYYEQWGAVAKTNQLATLYPYLGQRRQRHSLRNDRSISTAGTQSSILDVVSALKASEAILGEIVLDKLLASLIRIVLENAGAQVGHLILKRTGAWRIEASSREDIVTVLEAAPLTDAVLPLSIVNFVTRAEESVVLANASSAREFANDPYIISQRPVSVLCMPLINQGRLTGVLYLENNLASDAFTADRIEMLNLLSSQAAISIENATLYTTLEEKVEQRTAQLALANEEISALNERLKEENVRMGAELSVAQQLQKMILPTSAELAQIPHLDIAAYMEPTDEVGGDYYDVLNHNGRVHISMGDVTGHGLASGVLMLQTQMGIRTLLDSGQNNLQTVLASLNRTLYQNAERMKSDRNLSLVLLSYEGGMLTISGQHEDVLIVRRNGSIERIDTIELGFPVGFDADIEPFLDQLSLTLHEGDGIVLYTDGITEAEDVTGELYELDRLCAIVGAHWSHSAEAIKEAIIIDLAQHTGNQPSDDDITLLVLKRQS